MYYDKTPYTPYGIYLSRTLYIYTHTYIHTYVHTYIQYIYIYIYTYREREREGLGGFEGDGGLVLGGADSMHPQFLPWCV